MAEYTGGPITKADLYGNMPEDLYHADPVPADLGGSLSVSGAKLLLPPGCPAVFDWTRHHPKGSDAMDTGTVVHGMLLGTGQPVEVLDFPDYRKKDAQEAKKAAIAAGAVPRLVHEYAECKAIAQAVLNDDECAGLLAEGDREVSMFAPDPESGIWLRGRMDSYTQFGATPVIVDVKTAADSSPEKFAKAVAEYRYDMQDSWYRELLALLLGCDPAAIDFVFVVVPTSPPYLPMAYRLEDERDLANAAEDCRIAREKFRDCTAAGVWPKWSADITPLELPGYARQRIERGINEWYR